MSGEGGHSQKKAIKMNMPYIGVEPSYLYMSEKFRKKYVRKNLLLLISYSHKKCHRKEILCGPRTKFAQTQKNTQRSQF